MSDRMAATIDFPKWALDIPEANEAVVNYFGEPDTWGKSWEMEENNGVLHFLDDQAPYGEFPEVQECFQKLDVPYDHWSEAKYEFEAYTEHFRPELKEPVVCNGNDRFVLYSDDIKEIIDSPNLKEELRKMMPPEYKSLHEYVEREEVSKTGSAVSFPLDGLHTAFVRFEEDGLHAICGDWEVGRSLSGFSDWWELCFAGEPVANCVPSEDFGRNGQFGDIKRLNDALSDKNFSDICDIIRSVSPVCRMAPEEQKAINQNKLRDR